ncbi:hypothetical protein CF327_g240 [Tilletia walkeri]|nr:hypothetical protein CF327_g240 [Tilletia walkeri]
MSRLDGVIILGADGRPLIQSHFRSSNALPLAHIDHFNHASTSSSSHLPPLLWLPGIPPSTTSTTEEDTEHSSWTQAEQGAAQAHLTHNNITLLTPLSAESNPLLPLTFLRTFLSLLAIYAGGLDRVNEASVREHFDVVYQLLEESLDEGWPLFTEGSALADLVVTQSWLDRVSKVVQATGLPNLPSAPPPQPTELSPIPWRRANISHWNEEFHADVIDSLEGTLSPSYTPIILELFSRISCRSRLSANPEVSLSVTSNTGRIEGVMSDVVLHPCVRHRKWTRDRVFSFVPPDGQFELAQFRIGEPLAFPVGSVHASSRKSKTGAVQLPSGGNGWERDIPLLLQSSFDVQPLEVEGRSGSGVNPTSSTDRNPSRGVGVGSRVEFSLTVQSRLPTNLPLENIVISIRLGPGAHSVDAAATGGGIGSGPDVPAPPSLNGSLGGGTLKSVTDAISALGTGTVVHTGGGKAGSWVFEQGSSMLRWEILKLGSAAERPAVLKGSFMTSDSPPRIASAVRTTFSIPNHSLSNVRVGSIHVAGEGPSKGMFKGLKVFKGIRTVVEGDLEWRRF